MYNVTIYSDCHEVEYGPTSTILPVIPKEGEYVSCYDGEELFVLKIKRIIYNITEENTFKDIDIVVYQAD